jgi:formate dehydrogenase maturation protein FdhE
VTEPAPETPTPPACPNCGRSDSVTLVSAFGGQIITSQWHCEACRTHFEAVRADFEDA